MGWNFRIKMWTESKFCLESPHPFRSSPFGFFETLLKDTLPRWARLSSIEVKGGKLADQNQNFWFIGIPSVTSFQPTSEESHYLYKGKHRISTKKSWNLLGKGWSRYSTFWKIKSLRSGSNLTISLNNANIMARLCSWTRPQPKTTCINFTCMYFWWKSGATPAPPECCSGTVCMDSPNLNLGSYQIENFLKAH